MYCALDKVLNNWKFFIKKLVSRRKEKKVPLFSKTTKN
jgi:hypothetical protein